MSILILSASDVNQIIHSIPALKIIELTAQTLLSLSHSNSTSSLPSNLTNPDYRAGVQQPDRISTKGEEHDYLFMPGRVNESNGIKIVAVPTTLGPPGIHATTMLMNELGVCSALINSSAITGLRTAACSALASYIYTERGRNIMTIIGSGTQAYWHAKLIIELKGSDINLVYIIVRTSTTRSTELLKRLRGEFERVKFVELIEGGEKVKKALLDSEIICCCTPSTKPLIGIDDVSQSVHINAIGSYKPEMHELSTELMLSANLVLVDSLSACLKEAGEIISATLASSNTSKPFKPLELGDIMREKFKDGKIEIEQEGIRKEGRTVYKGVGIAALDITFAEMVYEEGIKRGLGQRVPYN